MGTQKRFLSKQLAVQPFTDLEILFNPFLFDPNLLDRLGINGPNVNDVWN